MNSVKTNHPPEFRNPEVGQEPETNFNQNCIQHQIELQMTYLVATRVAQCHLAGERRCGLRNSSICSQYIAAWLVGAMGGISRGVGRWTVERAGYSRYRAWWNVVELQNSTLVLS